MTLDQLGWDRFLTDAFAPHAAGGLLPGRVTAVHRGGWVVATDRGELPALVTGRLRHLAGQPGDLPVVGDWVALEPGTPARVHAVLPRRTAVSRRQPGTTVAEQVLVAGVDLVAVLTAPGPDLHPRRVERLLALAWESGAEPLVVLSKADVADDLTADLAELAGLAVGVPLLAVSALTGEGLDALTARIGPGRTAVLLGPSGVGKSTLVNRLADREVLATAPVRDDGRGRHTTSHRQLVALPGGGLVVDTPGLRELGLWATTGDGTAAAFDDIEALAAGCRFGDCRHQAEPGCAVLAAVAREDLPAERLAAWRKLQRELDRVARRGDPRARAETLRRWKAATRAQRALDTLRPRD